MIDANKINEVLGSIIKLIKENYQYNSKTYEIEFRELPNFNPVYKLCIDLWEKVRVHSDGQEFPEKLFKSKAPNESEQMYEYRESIYQPITQSIWKRGITNYNRVFNKQNYAIDNWGNDSGIDESDHAMDYFLKEYPIDDSIESYYSAIVKNIKLEDPNAVNALWLELLEDDNKFSEPFGRIWHCDKVLRHEKDYTLILSEEKSIVKYFKRDNEIGFVFYLYDNTNIYKIEQVGDFTKWEFEIAVYYQHDLGYVPVKKLGGVPKFEDNEMYYLSEALDAIYPLNEIAFDNSTLQASKIANAFLEKYELVSECDNPNCHDGNVWDNENEKYTPCQSCSGSGEANSDPLGVHKVVVRNGETLDVPLPPAGYIAKDTTILEFLRKEIEINKIEAFSYLGVDVSNSQVSGKAETAMGKMIDRETLFSALLNFSSEIFDLMEFEIDFVGKVRYGVAKFENPTIKKPTNFAIRNEQDLTEEYGNAKDKGLPDIYTVSIMKQLTNTRFGTNDTLKKILELKQGIDRLFSLNNEESLRQKGQGVAADWEVILHTSFDTFLAQKMDEDDNYLDKNPDDIKTDLIAMSKSYVIKKGSVDSILI